MALASALLALVVAAAFLILLLAIDHARSAERRASHSQQVLVAANSLERLLLDLETGQRGYVLTRRERFLEPWRAARRSFPSQARTLGELVAGDPQEERWAHRIERSGRSYIDDYSVPLVNAARRGDPSARSVASTEAGKSRVDAMRADFDRLIDTERQSVTSSQSRVTDEAARASAAALIALAGSIVLIAAYAAYLTRSVVRPVRRVAATAGRLAGGDLSARLPATGVAEVGALERSFNVMAGSLEQSHDQLAALADGQAALRRVATHVARGATPEHVFSAVAQELAQLIAADIAIVLRAEPDATATVVGGWSVPDVPLPLGARLMVAGEGVAVSVLRSGAPAQTDRFDGPAGSVASFFHSVGARSGAGAPIVVEGGLWGAVVAATARAEPFPAGTETRIQGFTELVATAIANAQARVDLRRVADEQAALRRVATLVAQGEPPDAIFAAVAEEIGRLVPADLAVIARYDVNGGITALAGWSATGDPGLPGERHMVGGRNVTSLVFESRRPARIDDYTTASGTTAEAGREQGVRSAIGAPISVQGRLWGVVIAASTGAEPVPRRAEDRLGDFTELLATAIANTQAREELSGLAEEQAALRRVATLVARGATPNTLFAAVAAEVGRVLPADVTVIARYESDDTATLMASSSATGEPVQLPEQLPVIPDTVTAVVRETGRAARVDYSTRPRATAPSPLNALGFRFAVGAPIRVDDRLWGFVAVVSAGDEPPPGTEARLADFTELVGTAIANADAQAALTASRARVVASADETRRRIERDLHDGAQQRLVSLALRLRAAQSAVPKELDELDGELDRVATGLNGALDDLREFARGIHPSILAEGGLGPALKALARRSTVPVVLDLRTAQRLPDAVEVAAYFVVSEALANAAKHALASRVDVNIDVADGVLRMIVRDNGVGGASFAGGSGLVGLKDRVEALGGQIALRSQPGAGTSLTVDLPSGDTG